MSDLRDWLRGNKLEQYAEAFEANDIDLDILHELTERDLEQLGVSLGNRRRLLRAIAEGSTEAAKSDLSGAQAAADAERRQVTVLFCDMVGSSADVLRGHLKGFTTASAPMDGLLAVKPWPKWRKGQNATSTMRQKCRARTHIAKRDGRKLAVGIDPSGRVHYGKDNVDGGTSTAR